MSQRIDTTENRAPTLPNLIRRFVDQALRATYTTMPGRVESFDPETQKVAVQPLFRFPIAGAVIDEDTTEADLLESLPVLPEVPIRFMRTKTAVIYLPVKEGSLVTLHFTMQSMEKFLNSTTISNPGETLDPQDVRHHDLSDAFAVPGLYPFVDPIPNFDPSDIRIINEPAGGSRTEVYLGGDTGNVVVLTPDGELRVGDKDATERGVLGDTLQTELDTLLQAMIDNAPTFVSTGVGPGVLSPTVVTALTTFITNAKAPLELWLAEKLKLV